MTDAPESSAGAGQEDPRGPKFSVVVVNFNGKAFLQDALDSLARQSCRDFEVLLLDNASTDGSLEGLRTDHLPAFTLIAETRNHGYAAGNNIAVERAKGDWLVFLNPDAAAADDWLEQIADAQVRHPGVKAFTSAQFDMMDPSILDGAGDAYLIWGVPWRGGFGCPASDLPEEGECFSPCGAGAIMERATFVAHGGFDERFFCFCEDVDLGFRLRRAGETCIFLPKATIRHVGGGLSGRVSEFAVRHGARNRIWTYVKNMPLSLLVITAPGHVAISIYILIRGLMTGRAGPTFRGMMAGLAGLPRIVGSKDYRARQRVSTWKLARAMAWNPFRISSRKPHVRPLRADRTHSPGELREKQ